MFENTNRSHSFASNHNDTHTGALLPVSMERTQYRTVSQGRKLYLPSIHRSLAEPCSLPIVMPQPGQKRAPIKTQARSATILPSFVNLKFQVHNGKNYDDITITEEMVGRKLGEFAPTRKQFVYKLTKNK
ncbi:unnamed protein product [Periconia digitata]|uniref:Ribosomal protein S19 n=1 Tax=Periconia digitata TaxID=1303443 RepID=A0A9W4XDI6_9PLEO|nr:unnamed protein product [Periconia digitata]